MNGLYAMFLRLVVPPPSESSGDTRTDRSDEPQYQSEADAAAAAAVSNDDQCLTCIGLPDPS